MLIIIVLRSTSYLLLLWTPLVTKGKLKKLNIKMILSLLSFVIIVALFILFILF